MITVAELINILKKFPPDSEIVTRPTDDSMEARDWYLSSHYPEENIVFLNTPNN